MQPSMMIVRGRMGRIAMGDDEVEPKTPVTFRLLVKDLKDRAFTGVEWDIIRRGLGELSLSGKTNGGGTSVVNFGTTARGFTVRVHLPEGMVQQDMTLEEAKSQVMTIRSVQEAPQVLLNTMEIAAGSAGLGLILLGLLTKVTLVERIGETMVMATVFYRVGRAVI